MKRWIYVSDSMQRPVERVWTAFHDHGRQVLQGHDEVVRPDGSFVTHVHAPGTVFAPALRVAIGVAANRPDGRIVLPLSWNANNNEFAFPAFDGAIEFEPLSSAVTRVSIIGSYVPPLGVLGTLLDAAMLHHTADSTAETLLQRLVKGLPQAWEPGGTVGERRRSMTVGDVMTADPFVISADLPLKTAALLLFHLDVSGAPVVTAEGELVGVLTERDLLDKEAARPHGLSALRDEAWRRREAQRAGEACSRPARTTSPQVALHDAAAEMLRLHVGRLVVIDQGDIVGLVTRHDILVALVRNDADILHAARDLLTARGEPDIDVTVLWGVARLSGNVTLRSRRDGVIRAVEDIDGVMAVDADDLHWAADDVMPVFAPPM